MWHPNLTLTAPADVIAPGGTGSSLTIARWRCCKNFSQWERSFLWKLCCQWPEWLRERQIAVVKQGPRPPTSPVRTIKWRMFSVKLLCLSWILITPMIWRSHSQRSTRSCKILWHFIHKDNGQCSCEARSVSVDNVFIPKLRSLMSSCLISNKLSMTFHNDNCSHLYRNSILMDHWGSLIILLLLRNCQKKFQKCSYSIVYCNWKVHSGINKTTAWASSKQSVYITRGVR